MIIFAGLERRQRGARHGEFGAAQRLGGIAVGHFGKAGDGTVRARADRLQVSVRRPALNVL